MEPIDLLLGDLCTICGLLRLFVFGFTGNFFTVHVDVALFKELLELMIEFLELDFWMLFGCLVAGVFCSGFLMLSERLGMILFVTLELSWLLFLRDVDLSRLLPGFGTDNELIFVVVI